ncbi:hypothetical protein D6D02_06241 [Aureobasidium pullulans]|nr:hypothetical protein D6D03_08480 [Aureobasidium pullulans]THY10670.1 hypothetical protein D6D02_06241 [Aureobasidium pullulans]THY42649.1 hypothetical protein D6C98_08842 [Aureobasidium pullulans]
MAYSDPYNTLWAQQTYLFNEIDLLKHHSVDIERQLRRAQRTLANPETKRYDRRKAKWVSNSQQRYLKELGRALQQLLQSLSLCQARIAQMHTEASWEADLYGNAQHVHIDSLMDNSTTPTQETYQHEARSTSPDSGFSEPALYAHPFDLDLTQDHSNHVFSHEIQHPLPLTINTQFGQTPAPTQRVTLSPTAEDFTPTPKATHKLISPLAPPFSPFVFAKANPPTPSRPINAVPLFRQPIWSSPSDWSEQVAAEMTPISPTARAEEEGQNNGNKRKYSVAAIELIESRLRHKRQVSDVARGVPVQG